VDGDSQGAVLPTLDCYLLAPARGIPTRRSRSTSNAVCVVAQGQGSSRVGDKTFGWQAHDVFSLPHWNWVSHTATSDDAVIFMMTDREFLASIGYLRDEEES
jgi:gentisate 1,2-dioxygenase